MSEAVFPILGPLIVVVVVLPLAALVARLVLALVASFESARGVSSYQAFRYATLVGSSALPLCWFISASLHQAESGASALVCLAEHAPGADCTESAYFALALIALALLVALPRLVRDARAVRASRSAGAEAVGARIDALLRGRPALSALLGQVVVSNDARAPIATVGIVTSRVVVQTAFAESIDDEALAGALHHELEHFRDYDPLALLRELLGAGRESPRWLAASRRTGPLGART